MTCSTNAGGFTQHEIEEIHAATRTTPSHERPATDLVQELTDECSRLREERDEASFRAAEYWRPIIRQRDEWIVELIRERDEARQALRDGTGRDPSPTGQLRAEPSQPSTPVEGEA